MNQMLDSELKKWNELKAIEKEANKLIIRKDKEKGMPDKPKPIIIHIN